MPKPDTADTAGDAGLKARMSAPHNCLMQQAAAPIGLTLSEFADASAQAAALRVIAEHECIPLSRHQQLALEQTMSNPPGPSARRQRAAKALRQRTDQRTGA